MGRRLTLPGALLGLLLALLACKSKTGGNLTFDGADFEISECRSGQANSPQFTGVDFLDDYGRRVRFLQQPTGFVQVYFFAPGATFTDMLGEGCGKMTLQAASSQVNGITDIEGTVTANCRGGGHAVQANVSFERCH